MFRSGVVVTFAASGGLQVATNEFSHPEISEIFAGCRSQEFGECTLGGRSCAVDSEEAPLRLPGQRRGVGDGDLPHAGADLAG